MNRRVAIAALLMLASAPAARATQGWSYDGELGAAYDGNPGNAAGTSDDVRSAGLVNLGVGANYNDPHGLYTTLQWRGAVAGQAYANLGKLSNALGSVRVRLLHKPGEAFYVPVLAAWTSAGYRASASSIRSGSEWRAGAYLTEPVTTQVQARIGGSWLRRDANGRTFDGSVRGYELNLDWAPAPAVTVYGGYRVERGPIVVSADGHGVVTPKTEHIVLMQAADAIERDDAFGAGWWAFRVMGRTGIATLGANVLLTKDLSLDLQARRAHATVSYDASSSVYAGGGGSNDPTLYPTPHYDRWLAGASLLFRF